MSTNHFSSTPEPFWWTQPHLTMEPPPKPPQQQLLSPPTTTHHHHHPTTSFSLNLNDDDCADGEGRENPTSFIEVDKEPMFEKPLTPSDVGKLNRLVIPKQHAEKYFPLGGDRADSAGLLLSFEDESGKFWRFRYSYWNSSQSYVLTKGWSRYVKEKRLDAGDVILFERHRSDGARLFIGWRRRSCTATVDGGAVAGYGGGWGRGCYYAHAYPVHPNFPSTTTSIRSPYQPDSCLHAGAIMQNQTTPSGNNSKRLVRLFGVNLECQPDHGSEPSTPDGSSSSSQGQAHYPYVTNSHASNTQRDMEVNFSRGVNQMRYHQG